MAALEGVASVLTGNIGFMGESFHNAEDALSFGAKRLAMNSEKPRSLKLRKAAATILAFGGIATFGGAAYHSFENKNENGSDIAIAIAAAAALVNTRVAFKAHSAENDGDKDEIVEGAHLDSKLHAAADAGTGWLYTGGLLLERYVPGTANYVVMFNGVVLLATAGTIFRRAN